MTEKSSARTQRGQLTLTHILDPATDRVLTLYLFAKGLSKQIQFNPYGGWGVDGSRIAYLLLKRGQIL